MAVWVEVFVAPPSGAEGIRAGRVFGGGWAGVLMEMLQCPELLES